jgi:hypothetical protein
VEPTFPSSEPGRHGWAELLTLVDAIRRLAYDRTLAPNYALGRIRDLSATTTITRRAHLARSADLHARRMRASPFLR